ncbi:hypothetical protein [Nocardia amamiensis]|uniref:hypothetical protein n=1 Tax=Nocardia TaxID=1817 RepID=UPI0033CD5193
MNNRPANPRRDRCHRVRSADGHDYAGAAVAAGAVAGDRSPHERIGPFGINRLRQHDPFQRHAQVVGGLI